MVLGLGSNQLTSLPAEIGQLTSLRELDLERQSADEPAGGDRAAHLAEDVGPQQQSADELAGGDRAAHVAEGLHLGGNQLTSVPAEIGQLTSLTGVAPLRQSADERAGGDRAAHVADGLDLGGNQLTSVPAEIGQLTSLKELDLGTIS